MKIFQELGELIEKRWRDRSYNEDIFPEVAAEELTQFGLSSKVDPWEILEWVLTGQNLPEQSDVEAKFSNAPITLYTRQRFYIDAYFWLDGTTTIHQHSFSGAFQVLHGSSIHSTFSFIPDRQINDHFVTGEIKNEKVELLEKDYIQAIDGGEKYIHSLFHLDRPSVTITIRTANNPTKNPQYDYHKPFVAYNPFFKEQALQKKLQSLFILLGMEHPKMGAYTKTLLADADLQTTFFVLEYLRSFFYHIEIEKSFGLNIGIERFNNFAEVSKTRHGDVIDKFLAVYEEKDRQTDIIKRRGVITEPEHRFFLALLLNVDERSRLFDLIKKKFPDDDPIEKILDWTSELSATKVFGAKESNVLGIADFNDDYVAVLECLLKGAADKDIENAIAQNYAKEYADCLKDSIEGICKSLRGSMMFKTLLR